MARWQYALLFVVVGARAMEQKKVEDASNTSIAVVKKTDVVSAQKEVIKDAPKRDPFASQDPLIATVAASPKSTQNFIVHGIVIAEKPYALISYDNNLFTVTIKDTIGVWQITDITLDYVQIKLSGGETKKLPLELRVNTEGA